ESVVNLIKADIQFKHNEVIAFNDQLKEHAIKQAEQDINQLTNQVFAAKNKIENLLAAQQNGENRLQDIEQRLQDEQDAIAET
ncbi:hypothetical protein ABTK14_23145, partial [Acinetobacter baumannii]